ncbi:general secretion pathway protein C [Acidovorax sp. sic0104]|uniref:general secretion pathway protein C n=1 Tax=Acidovorax sp. sic0104 TaxID=2854784 RepID=UPI001C46C998|nr:general secretion pathway protein C [Acidovorax sp. sic0104]MBV7540107.1 general secretion pathway protein C [Acidovorax sp. sic0104]
MVTNSHSKWGVRLGTLALWAAAGASMVFWGLRLSAPAAGTPAPVVLPVAVAPDAQALARLLGAGPAVASAAPAAPVATLASRFSLIGVLSGRASGGGAALIVVDGKPAKPFRVGAAVDEGLVLQALGPRQAQLGGSMDGPATLTLDMPLKN